MNKPAIIFDLDGTLIDSAPDLINTLNHILTRENCPPAPPAEMRQMISLGARAMLKKGFELGQKPQTEDRLDELWQDFITHYSAHIAVDSRPFPGTLKTLEHLKAAGHPLGICTNKTEELARKLITALDMQDHFKAIVGVDTLGVKKPHPGHVTGTIKAAGGNPQNAVMVGDSETDIAAAKATQIPVIAVDFGYSIEPVATFSPDAIISTYDDLLLTLSTLIP